MFVDIYFLSSISTSCLLTWVRHKPIAIDKSLYHKYYQCQYVWQCVMKIQLFTHNRYRRHTSKDYDWKYYKNFNMQRETTFKSQLIKS